MGLGHVLCSCLSALSVSSVGMGGGEVAPFWTNFLHPFSG